MTIFRRSATLALSIFAVAGCDDPEGVFETDSRLQEVRDNLLVAGVPEADLSVVELTDDDGEIRLEVALENDVLVDLSASREWADAAEESESGFRHYRGHNLVSTGLQRICLQRDFSGSDAWSNVAQPSTFRPLYDQALSGALDQINRSDLNLPFDFVLSVSNCDAVIRLKTVQGSAGGYAYLPWAGSPGHEIYIGSHAGVAMAGFGTEAQIVATLRHIIMHEIGHTMGFRHSDWKTGASCGGRPTAQGTHIWVPGTPLTGGHTSTVMASCYDYFETGTWSITDVNAWNSLY